MFGGDPVVRLNLKHGYDPRSYIREGLIDPEFVKTLVKIPNITPKPRDRIPMRLRADVGDTLEARVTNTSLVFVGCGGTGSHLIGLVLQYLKSLLMTHKEIKQPSIVFIDGDSVEPHNLIRQKFIEQDVGKNKAVALADRYSAAFGLEIMAIPSFLPLARADRRKLSEFIGKQEARRSHKFSLVFSSVDNAAARFYCMDLARSLSAGGDAETSFLVDMGNDAYHGQALFSMVGSVRHSTGWISRFGSRRCIFRDEGQALRISYVESQVASRELSPTFLELYPSHIEKMLENLQIEDHVLCVNQAEANPQTIHANTYAAMAGATFYTMYIAEEITATRINFDARTGVMSPVPILGADIHKAIRTSDRFRVASANRAGNDGTFFSKAASLKKFLDETLIPAFETLESDLLEQKLVKPDLVDRIAVYTPTDETPNAVRQARHLNKVLVLKRMIEKYVYERCLNVSDCTNT